MCRSLTRGKAEITHIKSNTVITILEVEGFTRVGQSIVICMIPSIKGFSLWVAGSVRGKGSTVNGGIDMVKVIVQRS